MAGLDVNDLLASVLDLKEVPLALAFAWAALSAADIGLAAGFVAVLEAVFEAVPVRALLVVVAFLPQLDAGFVAGLAGAALGLLPQLLELEGLDELLLDELLRLPELLARISSGNPDKIMATANAIMVVSVKRRFFMVVPFCKCGLFFCILMDAVQPD